MRFVRAETPMTQTPGDETSLHSSAEFLAHRIRKESRSIRAKEGRPMRNRATEDTTRGGATKEKPLAGDNTKDNFITKEAPESASSVRVRTNTETSEVAAIKLRPDSKVLVVDDTPVNVKVLVKMISRSMSAPIVSCFDGRSAIDLVASSNREDFLLLIMGWHTPGLCGLTATDFIRRLVKERGGPKVYICILTADVEGLHAEMAKRHMSCVGTVSKEKLIEDGEKEQLYASEKQSNGCAVVDIVAEKPVTFKSIRTILTWFQQQVERNGGSEASAVNLEGRKEGMALSSRYFKRLGLSQDRIDESPTLTKLQAICEAHLENIPFENLSQHGLSEPASLNVDKIANKILGRHRGGFCFELNGLLAELLTELGYKLARVIAHVYKKGGYKEDATHLFIMVTVADPERNNEEAKFLVDVGMGEPPIHPLRYDFDAPQRTPEGMVSRFVKIGGDVALEWLDVKSGDFVPRYKFKAEDASVEGAGPAFGDFEENLKKVHCPDSIFEQKLVVCSLTRSQKKTLAGSRLKITGPPRFDKDSFPVLKKELEDVDDVRAVLMSEFGIPLDETDGLQLTKSLKSPPELWTHL